jgi:hypothetical protein
MSHTCTWNANYVPGDFSRPGRTCGAPATKSVHLHTKSRTYKVLGEDGRITEHESEGKVIWLCDEHYASPHPWDLWRDLVVEA